MRASPIYVDNWGNDGVSDDWVIGRFNSVIRAQVVHQRNQVPVGTDFEFQSVRRLSPEPIAAGTSRSPNVAISGTAAFSFGKPNFLERRSYPDERRIQVSDTATWLTGKHLVKFGVDVNRTNDVLDNLFSEGGVYSYASRADFLSDYELNIKLGGVGRNYTSFAQGIGPAAFEFATIDYAGFVQDSWHIAPGA